MNKYMKKNICDYEKDVSQIYSSQYLNTIGYYLKSMVEPWDTEDYIF